MKKLGTKITSLNSGRRQSK